MCECMHVYVYLGLLHSLLPDPRPVPTPGNGSGGRVTVEWNLRCNVFFSITTLVSTSAPSHGSPTTPIHAPQYGTRHGQPNGWLGALFVQQNMHVRTRRRVPRAHGRRLHGCRVSEVRLSPPSPEGQPVRP